MSQLLQSYDVTIDIMIVEIYATCSWLQSYSKNGFVSAKSIVREIAKDDIEEWFEPETRHKKKNVYLFTSFVIKFKHVVFARTSLFLLLTRINLQLIICFRSYPSGIYELIQNSGNLNNKCNGLYEKKWWNWTRRIASWDQEDSLQFCDEKKLN